jgi:hypothetical protein
MKFTDKYELFDAITTGRLEAFMGRDGASGERVLVHIFDAPVKKPDQPTVLWALESFRAVAPEPPGLVIAAGRYGSTSYAYLVTQVPDEAILRKWTQAYESSTAETREIPAERTTSPEPSTVSVSSAAKPMEVRPVASFNQPAHPPTGLFGLRPPDGAVDPASEAVKLTRTPAEVPGNDLDGISLGPRQDRPAREPGEFTKQFFVGSNEPSRPSADELPVKPAASGIDRLESPADTGRTGPPLSSNAGAPHDPGGFTALFRPSPTPEMREITDSPNRIDATRKVDDGKAGDFTKFFQGPFDGERPTEIPDVSPNVSSPARGKAPGEFTQIFGSGKDSPFAATPSSPGSVEEPPLRTEPGSFTRSFSDADPIPSAKEPPLPSSDARGNGGQKAPTFPDSKWPEPVPSPVEVKPPAPPVAPRVNASPVRPSVQGGATQLFSVPSGPSSSSLPPPPRGPSEYTRIISGGMAGSSSSEEKLVAEEGPAASGSLPAFKMPAPAVPPVPKIAAPPAPKIPAVPAAPKVPPLGALAPKPKASYLPMIIILNVSLIIAVLLIVYFAIKH